METTFEGETWFESSFGWAGMTLLQEGGKAIEPFDCAGGAAPDISLNLSFS
jgi:hypothetical protein